MPLSSRPMGGSKISGYPKTVRADTPCSDIAVRRARDSILATMQRGCIIVGLVYTLSRIVANAIRVPRPPSRIFSHL